MPDQRGIPQSLARLEARVRAVTGYVRCAVPPSFPLNSPPVFTDALHADGAPVAVALEDPKPAEARRMMNCVDCLVSSVTPAKIAQEDPAGAVEQAADHAAAVVAVVHEKRRA
ncbi:hypothetical protein HLV35_05905 [Eggerthellaceae bacterium zg-997]|nr:hypothetical protein [Eggerthellaceae bacterium zg-997]